MKTRKGSILAYALIIITMMAAISAVMTTSTIIEKKSSGVTEISTQAYQTSDSGAQMAIKAVNSFETADAMLSDVFSVSPYLCIEPDGFATVTVEDAGGVTGSSYELTFFQEDEEGNRVHLACNDLLNDVEIIKSVGTYKNTVRAVEVSVLRLGACKGITEVFHEGGPNYDAEGNSFYRTVAIGSQCWLKENLNVGTFISSSNNQWHDCDNIQKYCYDDNVNNCDSDGGLYQLDQVVCGDAVLANERTQGICPDDWRVPTEADFRVLEQFLAGSNSCAEDRDGLDCNPAGMILRDSDHFDAHMAGNFSSGSFKDLGISESYWTSKLDGAEGSTIRTIFSAVGDIYRNDSSENAAFSVRCILGESCTPETCSDSSFDCGTYSDGCGGTFDCGNCSGTETCINGHCTCAPTATWTNLGTCSVSCGGGNTLQRCDATCGGVCSGGYTDGETAYNGPACNTQPCCVSNMGQSCTSGIGVCQNGTIQCDGSCAVSGNKPDGTSCGSVQTLTTWWRNPVCSNGYCCGGVSQVMYPDCMGVGSCPEPYSCDLSHNGSEAYCPCNVPVKVPWLQVTCTCTR